MKPDAVVERVDVAAYAIPTEMPESDGTLDWDSTTLVLVESAAAGIRGLGFTYADAATAAFVHEKLRGLVVGRDAFAVTDCWNVMGREIRNLGRPGVASMAIAAVDNALWDLKARLLDVPLVRLLGEVRSGVAVYGSGGFTSYSIDQLTAQLGGWARAGIAEVKMKVGRDPAADEARVRAARGAIGDAALLVDANGAYGRKQALALAQSFAAQGVTWFEEPVSSDDLEGLRLVRDRAPPGIDVTAGEYGYTAGYFREMLEAGAVDVLQADATRCAGITGFMRVAALCEAFQVPMSSHCAPSIHVHPCCAATPVRNLEYFHDHVRLERMLFDGVVAPREGVLEPDRTRPGLGIEFRRADAAKYAV